jgi:hypothetical protein
MTVRRALPLLLAPALLAACGGGGKKEPPRLTQRQFVDAGNKVCIASDRRVFRIGALSTDPTGWEQTAKAARRGIADMRAVRPPADRQAGFDRLLSLAETLRTDIATVASSLRAKKYERARTAQSHATQVDTKLKREAGTLGLTFCEQLLTNWPA